MTELETMLLQSLEKLSSESQEREARSTRLLNTLSEKCSKLTEQVQTLAAAQQDYRSLETTCKELADRLEKSPGSTVNNSEKSTNFSAAWQPYSKKQSDKNNNPK